jgi:hypothetical protein
MGSFVTFSAQQAPYSTADLAVLGLICENAMIRTDSHSGISRRPSECHFGSLGFVRAVLESACHFLGRAGGLGQRPQSMSRELPGPLDGMRRCPASDRPVDSICRIAKDSDGETSPV